VARKLKPTEYGGSDTQDTHGIQPAPHAREPFETLRLLAKTDPADPESGNDLLGDVT
jgi:hypothetical protein